MGTDQGLTCREMETAKDDKLSATPCPPMFSTLTEVYVAFLKKLLFSAGANPRDAFPTSQPLTPQSFTEQTSWTLVEDLSKRSVGRMDQ